MAVLRRAGTVAGASTVVGESMGVGEEEVAVVVEGEVDTEGVEVEVVGVVEDGRGEARRRWRE